MLFNSLAFLVFLPVVFLGYWALPTRGWRNAVLLAASYLFYGWWDWRFLALIFVSSLVDYVSGIRLAAARGDGRRRAWLALSLVVNLGVLGIFKYLDFGIGALVGLLAGVGIEASLHTLGLILPIGLSFYTLQTLSYTLDIYRGRLEPTRDPLAFFTFVAFFPQLVAGPIERARQLLPQFLGERGFDESAAADGLRQMLYGAFLKICVADNLGAYVDTVYSRPNASGWAYLVATHFFAFQIYGDFAGYSHIAIGCARLFGIQLTRNFAYPFFSQSVAEFWHRWHISLSTWFRDYVYIPMGGSRLGSWRTKLNVVVTFGLSGLWHGAAWNYVVWGLGYGLVVAVQGRPPRARLDRPGGAGRVPAVATLLRMVAVSETFVLSMVVFRAADLAHAVGIFARIGTDLHRVGESLGLVQAELWRILTILVVLGLEWVQRRRPHGLALEGAPRWLRWVALVVVGLLLIGFGHVEPNEFVYFQF